MPNKVFISYRREDSRYQARRIYDAFVHALPPDTVFMDVDSIPPGADFVEILEGWVQQCDILLALIGPRWIDSIDPRTNLRRLDNPEDFVRIEIRGALERKIPIVPVLLDAAQMPTAAELPDDIRALRRRHAEFVDFRTFDADVQRLIKGLKIGKKVEQRREAPADDGGGGLTGAMSFSSFFARTGARPLILVAAALLLLAAGAAGFFMSTSPYVDASTGTADFARSEESRRTAEARASLATDALAQAEKARQEAEAKATAAAMALAKTEESRQAAETRANDAAEALKKSEKARLDAEARATSAAAAQAKAEEAQRAADKARITAEGAASGAAIARAQADSSRQIAEGRANDAAEALKKSEKARQDAEAKLAVQAEEQRKSSRKLLAEIGNKSRWYKSGSGNCSAVGDPNVFSVEVGIGAITWVNGYGRRDTETILTSQEDAFQTDRDGSKRAYERTASGGISVQLSGLGAYVLQRCS